MDSRLLFRVEWFRDKAIEDRNVVSHRCDVKDTCIVARVNDVFKSQQAVEVQSVLGWGGGGVGWGLRYVHCATSEAVEFCHTTSGFDVYIFYLCQARQLVLFSRPG